MDNLNHNTLIVGKSNSGKTFYTKSLIENYLNNNEQVIIYNPTRQEFITHKKCFTYSNYEPFYKKIYASKIRSLIVIDESLTLLEADKEAFNTLITKGRHYGVIVSLTQRPKVSITQTIISQCRYLVLFRLTLDADIKFMKNEFNITDKQISYINAEKYNRIIIDTDLD